MLLAILKLILILCFYIVVLGLIAPLIPGTLIKVMVNKKSSPMLQTWTSQRTENQFTAIIHR